LSLLLELIFSLFKSITLVNADAVFVVKAVEAPFEFVFEFDAF
jgi:hypothetical protein